MFTYKSLLEACVNLDIDPTLRGDNILATARPIEVYDEPFDLTEIGFPEEELSEVLNIGILINNLISQTSNHHNLTTETGKKKYHTQRNIDKILPTLFTSQPYWLKRGLKKIKQPEGLKLYLCYGNVFQVDHSAVKSIRDLNQALHKANREADIKLANSRNKMNDWYVG